jgi:hypothetical protein
MSTLAKLSLAVAIVVVASTSNAADREPKQVLLEQSRFEFIEVPLLQVLSFLSDQHDIQIAVDVRATRLNEPITLTEGRGALGELLTKVLTPIALKYRTDAHAIIVEPIVAQAYSVRVLDRLNEERQAKGLPVIPKSSRPTPPRPKK